MRLDPHVDRLLDCLVEVVVARVLEPKTTPAAEGDEASATGGDSTHHLQKHAGHYRDDEPPAS